MIVPGLSTAWRTIVAIVVVVGVLVGGFYAYRAWDRYKQRERQKHLTEAGVQGDSAQADVQSGALLAAKADSQYVSYDAYKNRPETRANPVARELGNRADPVITTLKAAIKKDTSAIRHLESQVIELQAAGPPLGPRAVPYGDIGYGATTRHRAVPVVRLGLDYRIMPHVFAKVEGSYEPPPAGAEVQKPEFRGLIAAHITFR